MNRDDLLQKCVERGVADETSVEAVSHLFYVYLLSALQRGQRVEIPNFGTFGTRVIGVKKMRRMPFFEVDKELADKVNERFRQLKSLVIGRFELVSALVEEEYRGKEAPVDLQQEGLGKEFLLDTKREVPIEEYELAARKLQVTPPRKEKELMPKLNLKGDETEGEGQPSDMGSEPEQPMTQPPTLREMPSEGGMSPLLQIVLALLIVGAVTFALNYFGIVHLWGKKAQVVETLAPSEPTAPAEAEGVKPSESGNVPGTTPAPTPTPEAGTKTSPSTPTPIPGEPGKIGKASPARPTPVVPRAERKVPTPLPGGQAHERTGAAPSGGRNYTIQVSSWLSIAKANAEVASLEQAGLSAFVEDAEVAGRTMHRVRVGHYSTFREASEAAASLRNTVGEGAWVDRLR